MSSIASTDTFTSFTPFLMIICVGMSSCSRAQVENLKKRYMQHGPLALAISCRTTNP